MTNITCDACGQNTPLGRNLVLGTGITQQVHDLCSACYTRLKRILWSARWKTDTEEITK
jgi:hypothetical protein